MNRSLPAAILWVALFLSSRAEAFQKEPAAAKGCAECHKLTKEEAGKFLGKGVDNVVAVVQGPFPGIWEVDVASIPVRDAIRIGREAAKDADVAFLVMPYPRNRNDKATYRNCLAVVCSKSEKMLDDAYAGEELPAPSCKSDAVDETMKLADRLKIQGTPTMILPDGRMISGSMNADALLSLLSGGR